MPGDHRRDLRRISDVLLRDAERGRSIESLPYQRRRGEMDRFTTFRNSTSMDKGVPFTSGDWEDFKKRYPNPKDLRESVKKVLQNGHGGGNWRRLITNLLESL